MPINYNKIIAISGLLLTLAAPAFAQVITSGLAYDIQHSSADFETLKKIPTADSVSLSGVTFARQNFGTILLSPITKQSRLLVTYLGQNVKLTDYDYDFRVSVYTSLIDGFDTYYSFPNNVDLGKTSFEITPPPSTNAYVSTYLDYKTGFPVRFGDTAELVLVNDKIDTFHFSTYVAQVGSVQYDLIAFNPFNMFDAGAPNYQYGYFLYSIDLDIPTTPGNPTGPNSPVPEPATYGLIAGGALVALAARRRRKAEVHSKD